MRRDLRILAAQRTRQAEGEVGVDPIVERPVVEEQVDVLDPTVTEVAVLESFTCANGDAKSIAADSVTENMQERMLAGAKAALAGAE